VRIETGKKIKDELNGCLSAQYLGMSALVTYRLSLTQKLGAQVRENSLRDVRKAKESKSKQAVLARELLCDRVCFQLLRY
jgi:hypothetical protein